MQPSTGLFQPLPEAQSSQFVLPWVPKVRSAPLFVPTVPCLVHMLGFDVPFEKLSSVPPAGTDRFDCTKKALPNRLSATASAATLRFSPRGSVPVDVRCHTLADAARLAVYWYDPAPLRVTVPEFREI